MKKYLIIGGSAGAVGAVEAIRGADPEGVITVVSDEQGQTYSRPMIADYLSGEVSLEKLTFPSKDFWNKHNVQVCFGERVVKVDLSQKTVELENTAKLSYDKLLLATGGKPFIPKIEGIERKGVYSFTTMTDAISLEKAIPNSEKAVVIGGGLIGVSAAEALSKRGVEVTVVELKGWLLNLILDRDAAIIIERAMQNRGLSIITGHTVQKIMGRNDGNDAVGGVILDNGTEIKCDTVVVAIGVTPRTELAAQAGIKIGRGILVDRSMQTSAPDVYACGDAAESYDFIQKSNRVLALWPVAREGGRSAGGNMAGGRCDYIGGTAMSALNYFGVPIISVGLTTLGSAEGYESLVFSDEKAGVYKKIVLKGGIIVGMSFVGDVEAAGIVFNLMKREVNVEGFKQRIPSSSFSLASLPDDLRKKIIGA